MFNQAVLAGNLTRDCELRYTASGTAVANFTIAVNTGWGDNKKVLFMDCVVWKKQAEACSQYLTKGKPVLVSGELQERSWESDGQKRTKMEIVASTVKFLGGKSEGQQSAPPQSSDVEPF